MIKSHSVLIQARTTVVGTEGEQTYTYATLKTIKAGVQPNSLSPVELAAWGITDLAADSKIMFYDNDSSILRLMRAVVDGLTYEICAMNKWPTHSEAILTPVQGI
jgi:hypothetical protein